ncbi:MAG: hypothetical protein ACMUIU_07930 [bacterium]
MSKRIGCQVIIFSILIVVTLLAQNTIAGIPRFADSLPGIYGGYTYEHTNEAVVHVNKALAAGYLAAAPEILYLDPRIV